jgi:hypothetical protein
MARRLDDKAFIAAMSLAVRVPPGMFARLDGDGDGRLSRPHLQAGHDAAMGEG